MPDEENPVQSEPKTELMKLIDEWEQEHFVPVSFTVNVKSHIDRALVNLRERLQNWSS